MLSFLFRIALLAFAWAFASSAALAHRPYLSSERAPLVLENGRPAELRLLAVHGLLHCLGHDHAESAAAARMTAVTRQLLPNQAVPDLQSAAGLPS